MRRLAVLVANLPNEALTRSDDGWTPDLRLTAMTLEVAHATYRAVLAGLGIAKRGQLPEQLRVLPVKEPKRRRHSPEEMFTALSRTRPHH